MNQDCINRRAIVIGGSIGGLFAGLALRNCGWQVEIFESTSVLDGRGAGIVTHEALFEVIRRLGVSTVGEIGLPIDTRKVFDRHGAVVGSRRLPQTVTSWGRLHRLLLQAFPAQHYHCGKTLVGVEPVGDEVCCRFADGAVRRAPLVVAADGIRSAVRRLLEPAAEPEYAGYVAWRGLVDEAQFDTSELRELFPLFSFCLPADEQMLAYPVAGKHFTTQAGQRRCNAVWYRQADRDAVLPSLLTDINGQNNGESIAPNKVRPEVIAQMREAAAARLSPQHAAIVHRMEQPFIQPIYDVRAESMVHGRVALLGDAAFTARPHLGMGVTKAAEDALALAECLRQEPRVPAALLAYRRARQPVNEFIVSRSRQLGRALQTQNRSDADRRASVELALRETATDDCVRAFVTARESG